MATIKARKGRYTVIVRRRDYPTQCRTFQKRSDAQAWGLSVERQMEQGAFKVPVRATEIIENVDALLALYSDEISPTKRGADKEQGFIRLIREDPACRDLLTRRVADATGGDVAAIRDCWRNRGLAPATIVRRLSVVSHAFEMARKEWAIDCANPVRSIRLPRISNERARRVSAGEIDRIARATQSGELPSLVLLLAGTAMRRSEALSLTWDRVFLDERYVRLDTTKNGSRRDVPLPPAVVGLLRAMPRRRDGRIFSLTPDAASRAFSRAVRRARELAEDEATCLGQPVDAGLLVDLRLHDLRREAISRAVESGHFSIIAFTKAPLASITEI